MICPHRNQIYRHYKGKHYRILHVAKHTETGEYFVVYRAIKGRERETWIRSLSQFTKVLHGTINRFDLAEE